MSVLVLSDCEVMTVHSAHVASVVNVQRTFAVCARILEPDRKYPVSPAGGLLDLT